MDQRDFYTDIDENAQVFRLLFITIRKIVDFHVIYEKTGMHTGRAAANSYSQFIAVSRGSAGVGWVASNRLNYNYTIEYMIDQNLGLNSVENH